MNKNDNILKKWWFNFIVVPAIMGIIATVSIFVHTLDKTSFGILGWLIVFILAMLMEIYLLTSHKVKYRMEHYMFISVSILISIFVGFIISKWVLDNTNINYIAREILNFIIPPAMLFLFKTVLWSLLHIKAKGSINKDNQINDLLSQVDKLEKENEELKSKYEQDEVDNKEKQKLFFWR